MAMIEKKFKNNDFAILLNEVSGIREYKSKKDFLVQDFLKYFGAQEGHYYLINCNLKNNNLENSGLENVGKRLGPNDEIKQGDKFIYFIKN